jgi:hypothetical protein
MSQTRRLAAILAADVAGYSRLMGRARSVNVSKLNLHLVRKPGHDEGRPQRSQRFPKGPGLPSTTRALFPSASHPHLAGDRLSSSVAAGKLTPVAPDSVDRVVTDNGEPEPRGPWLVLAG